MQCSFMHHIVDPVLVHHIIALTHCTYCTELKLVYYTCYWLRIRFTIERSVTCKLCGTKSLVIRASWKLVPCDTVNRGVASNGLLSPLMYIGLLCILGSTLKVYTTHRLLQFISRHMTYFRIICRYRIG